MKLIEKPWGSEEIIESNDHYTVKKLFMKSGCRCSLQFHEKKHETIYVLSGILRVTIGDEERDMKAGMTCVITPTTVHRMEGVEDALYLESSTSELDDVIRVEDDYGRT